MPKGSEALDIAYDKAIERVEAQKPGFRDLAKRVLSWITHAKRPLTALELRHALAVEIGEPALDEDNLPETGDMICVCAGLVTINEENNIIRLVHYTTQEYFTQILPSWIPSAQTDITMACLTYLSFDVFAAGSCSTDKAYEARLESNPLYDYAANKWGHHACAALPQAKDSILKFLRCEALVESCMQAVCQGSYLFPRQVTGMHLVAYFDWTEVMATLLENGHDPDPKDSQGQTPLSWAAKHGSETVVKLLLLEDMVDLNLQDFGGRTPLHWAAINDQGTIVSLLLADDRLDLNLEDRMQMTPFMWAAASGNEAIVKLLLAQDGIDMNSIDACGRTALLRAAVSGNEAIVKLLLEQDGIDMNSKDADHVTALMWAAVSGNEAIVKLLVADSHVKLNSRSIDGRTALSLAARYGHDEVVQLLLARDGIDVDAMDSNGETALSLAKKKCYHTVVELLTRRW